MGGWFAPTPKKRVDEILGLVKVKKGGLLVDIGSGDGRFLIAAAKRGIKSLGFEINPYFYILSLILVKLNKVDNKAQVKLANFWQQDLSSASLVCVFIPLYHKKLEYKFRKELGKGTFVVTYLTNFPNWKPIKTTASGIYLYQL